MSEFVHLHNHSDYSTLDGLSKPSKMMERVGELNQSAIALTDHGVMFGIIDFYKEAQKSGIKPIIGLEAYVSGGDMREKNENFHLSLLAMNDEGYHNLIQLTTQAHLNGFYRRPRIDRPLLEKHSAGVICLSGCAASQLSTYIINDDFEKAQELNDWYKEVFGDRYYLELQDHGLDFDQKLIENIIKLSKDSGVPLVCTNDTHYVKAKHAKPHEVLLCVQTQDVMSNPKRMNYTTHEFYIKSTDEMYKLFGTIPGALENSLVIAERCNVDIPFGRLPLPTPDIPNGLTPFEHLKKLTWEGIKERYSADNQQAIDRAKYELETINTSGYVNYFLIVQDIINFGKSQKIAIGVRGSAAGSLVSYCLHITDIDPLRFDLSFERFLNPARIQMPDIDIDISDISRDEIFNYVTNKFGADFTARIITFNTMKARSSIRDVGRALEIDAKEVDRLAKLIPYKKPDQSDFTLDDAFQTIPEFQQMEQKPQLKELVDIAFDLEGVIRQAGTHAGGVVIAAEPLTNHVPLYTTPGMKGVVTTQWEMKPLEDLGLLKIDLLGSRTLSVLQNATNKVGMTIDQIPLDDPKTFEMLGSGNTFGVFQVESSGMQQLMRDDKPKTVEEVSAIIALYRPGSMEFTREYVARHKGIEETEYPHPAAENALKDTFGIIVYQEQVTQFVQDIAGFSPADADNVRYAVGKKKHDEMKKYHKPFIEGAVARGSTKAKAEELWKLVQSFAGYGFNKGHSTSYGVITVKTAYLKANYPLIYMISYLSAERADLKKVSEAVSECRRLKIDVLAPDINQGSADFTQEGESIRYGIAALKGVGDDVANAIVNERNKNGEYKSLTDFMRRLGTKNANNRVVDALAKAGAMDCIGERYAIMASFESIIKRLAKEKKAKAKAFMQPGLFGTEDFGTEDYGLLDVKSATRKERLSWEQEIAGAYLSENLLQTVSDKLNELGVRPISDLEELEDALVRVGGIVTDVRAIYDKKGNRMAFVKLEDASGSIEVTVFSRVYNQYFHLLKNDQFITVSGKVQLRNDKLNLLANSIDRIDNTEDVPNGPLMVKVHITMEPTGNRAQDNQTYANINKVLLDHPGDDQAIFYIEGRGSFPLKFDRCLFDSRLEEALRNAAPNLKITTSA